MPPPPHELAENVQKQMAHLPEPTRRKFLKMASAVSTAILLQNTAKSMIAVPKPPSKWFAALELDDFNSDDTYCVNGCELPSSTLPGMATIVANNQQEHAKWSTNALTLIISEWYAGLCDPDICDCDCSPISCDNLIRNNGNDSVQCASNEYCCSQCIVERARGYVTNCCGLASEPTIYDDCYLGIPFGDAITFSGHANMTSGEITGPISFSDIMNEIDLGQPIAILIISSSDASTDDGQALIIYGYGCDDSDEPYIVIGDPSNGDSGPYSYCDFPGNYYSNDTAVWSYTFKTIPIAI